MVKTLKLVERVMKMREKANLVTMAKYLKTSIERVLEAPTASCVTFQATYQPPLLVPGDPTQIKRNIFTLEEPPNAYYGIGGSNYYGIGGSEITLRTLICLLGLGRYKQVVWELAGFYLTTVVYDASVYDKVNNIPSYPQLPDCWEAFRESLEKEDERNKESESKRREIFRRMAGIIGIQITYVGASTLLKTPEYEENLLPLLEDESLLKAARLLVPPSYRDNNASLLYPLMEVAEASTLKKNNIRLKIGDEKEKGFDALIARVDRDWLFAYTPSAITSEGKRPPYRAEDITFDMTEKEAREFLEKSPERVRQQYAWLLRELGRISGEVNERELIGEVISLLREIKGERYG
jgi:hypothetical protein